MWRFRPRRFIELLGILTLACGGPDTPRAGNQSTPDQAAAPGGGSQSLTGAGASFPNPIYTKWFDAYNKKTGVQVNYQSVGSGGGIRQFTEGTVDFGATDGPMTDEQMSSIQGGVLHVPTVLGAVVLIYNLPALGDRQLKFDGATVADIYLGRITKWDDPRIAALNPGVKLPQSDIVVVHRSDGSGTSFIFTDYLSKISPAWKSKVGSATSVKWPIGLGGKGNEGVTQQVKQLEGSIGYVELIYALSNSLSYAQVKNAAGNFVEPSLKSVSAAAEGADLGNDFRVSITNPRGQQAYPIASFTWLLIRPENPDAAKGKAIDALIEWLLSAEAQAMAAGLQYAPLPGPVVEAVKQRLGARMAA